MSDPLVSTLYTTLVVDRAAGDARLMVQPSDAAALAVKTNAPGQAPLLAFSTASAQHSAVHSVPVECKAPMGTSEVRADPAAFTADLYPDLTGASGSTAMTLGANVLGSISIGNPLAQPDQVGATDYTSSYDGVVLEGLATHVPGRLLLSTINSDPVDTFFQTMLQLGVSSTNVQIGSNGTTTHVLGDVRFEGAGGALGPLSAANLSGEQPTEVKVNAYRIALNVDGTAQTLDGTAVRVKEPGGATAGRIEYRSGGFEVHAGDTGAAARINIAQSTAATALLDQDPLGGTGSQLIRGSKTFAAASTTYLTGATALASAAEVASTGLCVVAGPASTVGAAATATVPVAVAGGAAAVTLSAGRDAQVQHDASVAGHAAVQGLVAVSGPVELSGGGGATAGSLEAQEAEFAGSVLDVAQALLAKADVAVQHGLAVAGAGSFPASPVQASDLAVHQNWLVQNNVLVGGALNFTGAQGASLASTLDVVSGNMSAGAGLWLDGNLVAPALVADSSLAVTGDAATGQLRFVGRNSLYQADAPVSITVHGNLVVDRGVLHFGTLASAPSADGSSTNNLGAFNAAAITVGTNLAVAEAATFQAEMVAGNQLHVSTTLAAGQGEVVLGGDAAVAGNVSVLGDRSKVAGRLAAGSVDVVSTQVAASDPVVYVAGQTAYDSTDLAKMPAMVDSAAAIDADTSAPPGDISAVAYASSSSGSAEPADGTYLPAALWQYSAAGYQGAAQAGAPTWRSADGVYSSSTGAYTGSTVTTDCWGRQHAGEWVQLFAGRRVRPQQCTLTVHVGSSPSVIAQGAPSAWVVLGSADGSSWVPLDERQDVTSAFFQDVQASAGPLVCPATDITPPLGSGYGDSFSYFRLVFKRLFNASAFASTAFGTRVMLWGVKIAGHVCEPVGEAGTEWVPQLWGSASGARGMKGPAHNTFPANAYVIGPNSAGPGDSGTVVPTHYVVAYTRSEAHFPPSVPAASMSWTLFGYPSPSVVQGADRVQLDRREGVDFGADAVRSFVLDAASAGLGLFGSLALVFDAYVGEPNTHLAGVDVYGYINRTEGVVPEAAELRGAANAVAGALSVLRNPAAARPLAPVLPAGLVAVFDAAGYQPHAGLVPNSAPGGTDARAAEVSGPGRRGVMPNSEEACLLGTTETRVVFPAYTSGNTAAATVFYVARYQEASSTSRKAVLRDAASGSASDWYSGFSPAGEMGVAYHGAGAAVTASSNSAVAGQASSPWLLSTVRPQSYRANGLAVAVPTGTSLSGAYIPASVGINGAVAADNSAFQFKVLMYFSRVLSDDECAVVEQYLGQRYALPAMGYTEPETAANLNAADHAAVGGALRVEAGAMLARADFPSAASRLHALGAAHIGRAVDLAGADAGNAGGSLTVSDGMAVLGGSAATTSAPDRALTVSAAMGAGAGACPSIQGPQALLLNARAGSGPVLVGRAAPSAEGAQLADLRLDVAGPAKVQTALDMSGALSVGGNATFAAGFGPGGNVLANGLAVQGSAEFATVDVACPAFLLSETSSAVFENSLSVTGGSAAVFGTGLYAIGGESVCLDVTGGLTVAEDAQFRTTVVQNAATVTGRVLTSEDGLAIVGAALVNGSLSVQGNAVLASDTVATLEAAAGTTVLGNLSATAAVGTATTLTSSAGMRVTGNASVNGVVRVSSGDAQVLTSGLRVSGGALQAQAGLVVPADAGAGVQLAAAVQVSGNLLGSSSSIVLGSGPGASSATVSCTGPTTTLAPGGGAAVVVQNGLVMQNGLTVTPSSALSLSATAADLVRANGLVTVGGNLAVVGSASAVEALVVDGGAGGGTATAGTEVAGALVLNGGGASASASASGSSANVPFGFLAQVVSDSDANTFNGSTGKTYTDTIGVGFSARWLASGGTFAYSTEAGDVAPNGRPYAKTITGYPYLVITAGSPINNALKLSIAAWIKLPTSATGANIFGWSKNGDIYGGAHVLAFFESSGGTPRLRFTPSGNGWAWPYTGAVTANATPGAWVHLATVNRLDASAYRASQDIYLNGSLAGTLTMQTDAGGWGVFMATSFGNMYNTTSANYSFNNTSGFGIRGGDVLGLGLGISEVQFYSADLTAGQVASLYALGTTAVVAPTTADAGLPAGSVSTLKLAGSAADSEAVSAWTGSSPVVTPNLPILYASPVPGGSAAPKALRESGAVMDTTTDRARNYPGLTYVWTPSTAGGISMAAGMTLSFWYYMAESSRLSGYDHVPVSFSVTSASNGTWPVPFQYIAYTAGGAATGHSFRIGFAGYGGMLLPTGSTALLAFDTWHHVAITFSGTQLRVVIDGVAFSLGSGPNQYATVSTNYPYLYDYGWSVANLTELRLASHQDKFKGYIGDVRLFSRALSTYEIRALRTYDPAAGAGTGGFLGTVRFESGGLALALSDAAGGASALAASGSSVGFNGLAGSNGVALAPFQVSGRLVAAPGTRLALEGDVTVSQMATGAESNIVLGGASGVYFDGAAAGKTVTMNGAITVEGDLVGTAGSDLYIMKAGETGGLVLSQGQLMWCNSDARIKTEVEDAPRAACVSSLQSIRVREFEYIPEFAAMLGMSAGQRRVGVVAQELAATHPEQVRRGPSLTLPAVPEGDAGDGDVQALQVVVPDLQTVNTGRQLFELIGAVQLLDEKMASLEARVDLA